MKNLALAAFAALSLAASLAPMANAADANTPGDTGRVVVRGDHSTVAGDAAATRMQQTGVYNR